VTRVPDTECIHGLDFAACDSCSPKKVPVEAQVTATPRTRTPRVAAGKSRVSSLKAAVDQRLHVVLTIDDLGDFLAAGELVDPIYSAGPEEIGWAERLHSSEALESVVLVVRADATGGPPNLTVESVQLIAVANVVVQEQVRELLAMTDYRARVAVHPPWFSVAE
jgi:hypothetical protein